MCLALDGAEQEPEGRHATFRVRGRPFAYFLDNHHGDGVIGVSVRCPVEEGTALAARLPDRYFNPAYMGPRGWLGVRLEAGRVDWADVEARVVRSHGAAVPAKKAAAPTARVKGGGTSAGSRSPRTPRPRPR
ncbi:MAG: MmcQ/YjbR family DNA-binding protein [Deltaproteobacteria bacterium]|nr:MmcQ/YjbR family DNA-binding protein [Deltaproteobacteria bacterium]